MLPLLLTLVAGGCTGAGDGADTPAASPTAAPTSTQSPSPSPSPAVGLSPTDEPAEAGGAPCTADDSRLEPGVPGQAERVEEVTADLDGDGAADRVVTYAVEGEDATTFHLRVVTDAGYVVEASLDAADAFAPVQPLGAARIGTDRDVVFVAEAASASAVLVSLWGLAETEGRPCALSRVATDDAEGDPLFRLGGSLAGGGGLACRDVDGDDGAELVVSSTTRTDDERWEWHEQALTWSGSGLLQPVGEDSGTVDSEEETAPYLGLDCDGVASPGSDA